MAKKAAAAKVTLPKLSRAQKEEVFRQMASALPKKLYLEASGKSTQVCHEQADRWEIPLRGRTIDLRAILQRFHAILVEHGRKLSAIASADELDPAVQDASSPYLEEKRKWESKQARLKYETAAQQRIRRDDVDKGLEALAVILQNAGEALLRQFGPDAQRIVNDALEDFDRNIPMLFGAHADNEE